MNKTEFLKIFAKLTAAFPGVAITPETLQVYFEDLADIDPELLNVAVVKIRATFKGDYGVKFPTIAHLREAAESIVAGEQLTGLDAWGMVMADVRRGVGYPYAGTPDNPVQSAITDPVILRCVQSVGGWGHLQRSTDEQDISNRSQFILAY